MFPSILLYSIDPYHNHLSAFIIIIYQTILSSVMNPYHHRLSTYTIIITAYICIQQSKSIIIIYRILEIRDVSDIDELIRAELYPVGEESSSSSSSSSYLNASSGAATMSHSKPQRPGKGGKVKISKFKIED